MISVWEPNKLKLDRDIARQLQAILQQAVNRLYQGECRYSKLDRSAKSPMTRLGTEFKAYKKTGNIEHLFNVMVYCILEIVWPENKKFHYSPEARSATRND